MKFPKPSLVDAQLRQAKGEIPALLLRPKENKMEREREEKLGTLLL